MAGTRDASREHHSWQARGTRAENKQKKLVHKYVPGAPVLNGIHIRQFVDTFMLNSGLVKVSLFLSGARKDKSSLVGSPERTSLLLSGAREGQIFSCQEPRKDKSSLDGSPGGTRYYTWSDASTVAFEVGQWRNSQLHWITLSYGLWCL